MKSVYDMELVLVRSNDKQVNKYTRAGKNGKSILCPVCKSMRTVYHFNFSGLTCPKCKESVDKYDWEVYN